MENLLSACRDVGLEIPDGQLALLGKYHSLLTEKGADWGVIAPSSPQEILYKHVFDALLGLKISALSQAEDLADVGSGGGLPGIPLRIARPELRLTLVEPNTKKQAFLRYALGVLNIDAEILGQRTEQLVKLEKTFQTVTARAFKPLPMVLEFMLPLAITGGYVVLYEGPSALDKIEEVESTANALGASLISVSEHDLPLSFGKRVFIILRKVSSSPGKS